MDKRSSLVKNSCSFKSLSKYLIYFKLQKQSAAGDVEILWRLFCWVPGDLGCPSEDPKAEGSFVLCFGSEKTGENWVTWHDWRPKVFFKKSKFLVFSHLFPKSGSFSPELHPKKSFQNNPFPLIDILFFLGFAPKKYSYSCILCSFQPKTSKTQEKHQNQSRLTYHPSIPPLPGAFSFFLGFRWGARGQAAARGGQHHGGCRELGRREQRGDGLGFGERLLRGDRMVWRMSSFFSRVPVYQLFSVGLK